MFIFCAPLKTCLHFIIDDIAAEPEVEDVEDSEATTAEPESEEGVHSFFKTITFDLILDT
jgi:hypothetical protein